MAVKELNLGRVKGDPLTWDDLTDEQKESLRGQKGDDGRAPIIKVGTVTTIDSTGNANVNAHTEGNTTTFDFQIPRGETGGNYTNGILNTIEDVMLSEDSEKFPGVLAIKELMEEITDEEIAAIFNN